MSTPRLVVIGSGPAAISAVEAYSERQPEAHIRILTADDRPPYERPPLSKDFLRGDTDDVDLHPRQWFDERAIELTLESPVRRIDVGRRVVEAAGGQFDYDALIVASGASPKPLEVPGGERALLLRSLSDSARLRTAAGAARSAVVIGAGFIGCEAAASLALMGLEVTLVAPSEVPQQKRLGDEAGRRIKALVEATGARFAGGSGVASIDGDAVRLDDGRTITADLVLAATGVAPNGAIAEAAGISLEDGRILVGADMRTNVDGVYAAGDVAKAVNSTAGRALAVEHWQDAMDHGEVAGASAAGDDASWSSVPGFWTEIGDAAVKYHAWGDGYDRSRFVERDGGFTVWYESEGRAVGVLTYESDDDYDLGEELIAAGKPAPTSA
ncbi:pyridine nucleotide-disulfide oxidoreductase [Mycolicibacterium arabiense]|uniref:Pyridine nucleotide-disulfide oxidoreductase n=1 Tax=Mycolicibacterium arabiense TaxID=1286181 RepID=A0A7I7RV61_9MYCO|nr:FAD-dependent oxidoreductase [Mycolicibacterium arabiense]MCV7375357.1 FAD-dependent oxidoreductase [Mycolicibacterium arabiense]BBY48504.1 pyridine nucleotide-disulfide oxidoreductase [Mycolicibacterium arabiense]